MAKTKPTYDVFISHRHEDAPFVREITNVLRSYDLQVFTSDEVPVTGKVEDVVWDAMAESQAVVAVISGNEPNALLLFELGAAKAWNKPVYGIVSDPSSTRLSASLHGLAVYPVSRIEEVAQEIKRSAESLSQSEQGLLVEEYQKIGVPVDQLALQPHHLTQLTKRFARRAKRQTSGEQLLRHLLRLRKQGSLPAMTKKSAG